LSTLLSYIVFKKRLLPTINSCEYLTYHQDHSSHNTIPAAQEHTIDPGPLKNARRVLEGIQIKRARHQRAYGDGLISYEDFAARLMEIESEADEARQLL
jgi:hypothetical protein